MSKEKEIATFFMVLGIILLFSSGILFLINTRYTDIRDFDIYRRLSFSITFFVSGTMLIAFSIYVRRIIENLYREIKYLQKELMDLRKVIKNDR